MKKFLFFIIILLLLAGGAGFWFYQKNTYSKEILKLEILGQEEVSAFQEIEYKVKYKNNGNTTLEEVKLTFQYPENSFPTSENALRIIKELEDIYPGQEGDFTFKGRIFWKENETKKAEAFLNYRPKELKAFYESKTSFTTKIKYMPLTFDIDIPSRTENGKEFKFSLIYFSNSDWPLVDLRAKIEYPLGFEFIESFPRALDKTDWEIPVLNKTEGGKIEIKGKLFGEVKEEKLLKASFGFWQNGEFILLKETTKGTEIIKPSLTIFQYINGVSQYAANPGDILHYEILFRNIGDEPLSELFLVSTLEGEMFDFETLKTDSGQFNKGGNYINWDWRQMPQLRFLEPGEEGKVEFWVNIKEDIAGFNIKNPFLKNRVVLSQAKEEFETKVNSNLVLTQKGYFADEIFGNEGPFPPQAGQTTTFTVIWQVKNFYNNLKDVKIKAVLSQGVRFTGKIFPEQESSKFALNSQTGEIVWLLGDLSAGAGVSTPAPNIAFQIALTPTIEQKGQIISLLKETKISGEDDFTKATLEKTLPVLDTTLPDDNSLAGKTKAVQ